jgi:hypothetical protein
LPGLLKPKTCKLYASLGIVPLQREELYRDVIFPQFEAMSMAGKLATMQDVRSHYPQMVASGAWFEPLVAAQPFVTTAAGKVLAAQECFDPAEPLFGEFFEESFPSPAMVSWLPFLRQIGMQQRVTAPIFLRCCEIVTVNPTADVRKASALTKYLFREYASFKLTDGGGGPKFFEKVAQLPIAPVFCNPLATGSLQISSTLQRFCRLIPSPLLLIAAKVLQYRTRLRYALEPEGRDRVSYVKRDLDLLPFRPTGAAR